MLLERNQKRDQAKRSRRNFSAKFCSSVERKKHQSRFFTRATSLVAPKMVIPPLPTEFFYPYPQSLRTVGVRSYAHVIIKFSQTHRFPIFYSYGAPLLVRGRSAICPSLDKNSSSRFPSLFLSSLESFSVLSLRAKLGERVAL